MRWLAMSQITDNPGRNRLEMSFPAPSGGQRLVFADYIRRNGSMIIPHVEADPELRGSGAAGAFMAALAEYARVEGLKLIPTCGYAVAWFRRHPDAGDVLAG